MHDFEFTLTEKEMDYLRGLVQQSIGRALNIEGQEGDYPPPVSEEMKRELGAFVTIKKQGTLRGCIGNILGSGPLWKTIVDMAKNAAFKDPRFPPVKKEEYRSLSFEISVLSPLETITDVHCIEPGRHGLLIRRHNCSGLLLPQVATEQRWDRNTFLTQTCRKAGLPGNCWQDPQTKIFCFQARVF